MEIDSNDTIILEICSNKTYYEFINEETTIVSNIYEYINTATINNNNYIKFSNTSQSRNANISQYFYRIDNINLKGKIIFDNIIVNESRLKYINFLKQKLNNIPNCYFFENQVTNDLIGDEYHYNDFGYKTVGKKFEMFLDTI